MIGILLDFLGCASMSSHQSWRQRAISSNKGVSFGKHMTCLLNLDSRYLSLSRCAVRYDFFASCHKEGLSLNLDSVRLVRIHLKQGSVKLVFLDEILV